MSINLPADKRRAVFTTLLLSIWLIVSTVFGQAQQSKSAKAVFDEAEALFKEGTAESYQAALGKFQEAGRLYQESGDKNGEAQSLVAAGLISNRLGEKAAALKFYERALTLFRSLANTGGEARALNNIGRVYNDLGEQQKALEYYNQALPLYRTAGDKRGEANALNNIGVVYSELGDKQKALEYFNQALPIRMTILDMRGAAEARNNLGLVYAELGEHQKALEHLNQALPLYRISGEKRGEATALHNIGTIFFDSGELAKALEYYTKALSLGRVVGDRGGEAATLNSVGLVYSKLGEHQKALENYNQALSSARAVSDRGKEAVALANIGGVYSDLGERRKALEYIAQSLPLRRAVGDRYGEAGTLNNAMYVWQLLGNRRMAVFYGKLSVNLYQGLRGTTQRFDNEIQKSFLRTIKDSYEDLCELLIKEIEIEQAVQVLNLYRDQQFYDFNRDTTASVKNIPLSPREKEFSNRYTKASELVGRIGSQIGESHRQVGNRNPSQQESAQLQKLEDELKIATEDFLAVLKDAEGEFAKPPDEKDKVAAAPEVNQLQVALRELSLATKQKTAILYTLIGEDKFYILLITPDEKVKVFSSPIKAADFNAKVLEFHKRLRDPRLDPRPPGKELYDIIFKPVEAELQNTGTQTLMWQLDGSLRYVPMAALFDGKKFLVERYQNTVFTRIDAERLMKTVSADWTGTGFGSSQIQTVDLLGDGNKLDFPALPGVVRELQAIFRVDNKDAGILSGKVYSDEEFTKDAFLSAMKQRRPLVHIASHFAFRPGDASRSFLLLGDGTALTLSEMKQQENLFAGVELLTLSACNTAATQPDANGREIDGFAELAQRLGAGSVMASLWSVADESTQLLMSEFYRSRKGNPQLTKTAAMQLAQRKMIEGRLRPSKVLIRKRDTVDMASAEASAPVYPYDPKKPYAHPYYWSPFVLIGNWR